ncbi:MAG TPA: penicillin-binding protein 2 [Gemmatimonadota bacterium]|nr:penicillin-binding protein 2 [Gemmatimonadota bacterium]
MARTALFGVFVLLIIAFFRLQVVRHAEFALQATSNQVRTVPLPAPRGFLYDRNGQIIAENVPAYSVSILPPSSADLVEGMAKIAPILELDAAAVDELIRQYRLAPGQPVLIDDDIDYHTLSLLEERRDAVPGLLLQPKPRRVYPHGRATAHLTGYVAQINERELSGWKDRGYAPGDIVGKTGLERMYEARMQGEKGAEHLEVDVLGRRVGPWSVMPFEPPRRGEDLRLTVDLDLQRRAAELFPEGKRGSVVGLDPSNGDVLLLYSSPSYDPNVFSGRVTAAAWNRLVSDPDKPLLNRAVQALYSPGSVFKLATAAMAMSLGIVDPDEYQDVPCRGGYQFGRRWSGCHAVHGWATLRDAIVTSCDTYFYQLGLTLGLEELTRLGMAWGLDEKTGVDLPNETRGLFPESVAWYDQRYGSGGWGPGVVLNLSIGQGEIAMTPLKQAQLVAAIVNGGTFYQPRLLKTDEPPIVRTQLPLASDQYEILTSSLTGVVNDWRGTAYRRAHSVPLRYTIGGKSGTVEHNAGKPHGWFVAAGPMDNPQIVVALVVEEGLSGSAHSPMAIDLVQMYLDGLSGLAPPNAGLPPPIALSEGALTQE